MGLLPQTIRTYLGYATMPCFIISGLILNIAQLIVYVTIRPFSQQLFRDVNHYLQYSYWSQPVAVVDWLSNFSCRVTYKDEQTRQEFGSMSGIVIANHRYDVDWLAAWMLSDKLGLLGGDKAMLKSSLRMVPVIGWGWSLCDMIFLSRNWKKDQDNLRKSTDVLLTYKNSLLLSFYEGTRLTPSKFQAAIKFAEERNLPYKPKHHLVPRTRGFHCMMERVQARIGKDRNLKYGLYNFQVAVKDNDNSKATLTSILSGVESCVHIYVERIDPMKVPVESEEATAKYLFDLYSQKDELHEYFMKHGRFPGLETDYKPKIQTLLNWCAWMCFTYSAVINQYYKCFTSGSPFYIIMISTLTLTAIFSISMLVNSTKVSRSSGYGTNDLMNMNKNK